MDHPRALGASFSQTWRNPSLLGVLLVEFILSSLSVLLFALLDLTILWSINSEALAQAQTAEAVLAALANGPSIALSIPLVLIEGFILVGIVSYFRAGFYGMAKNVMLDGSTTIREFLPESKRHFLPIFKLELIRYGALALAALPLIVSLLFVPASSLWAGGFFLVMALLILFALFYAPAVVVFEDESAIGAIEGSIRGMRARFGTTLLCALIVLAMFLAASALENFLIVPFASLAQTTGQAGWAHLANAISLLYNVVRVLVGIWAMLYLFHVYMDLSGRAEKKRKRSHKRAKV